MALLSVILPVYETETAMSFLKLFVQQAIRICQQRINKKKFQCRQFLIMLQKWSCKFSPGCAELTE